jgi:pilus assembly protein CpaC
MVTRLRPHGLLALGLLFCFVAHLTTPGFVQAQLNGGPRSASDSTNIALNIGEQRVLSAQGVKSYSEGVRGVVDVRLTGDASRFVMVGTAKGITTLLLIMVDGTERTYTITVTDPRDTGATPAASNPFAVPPNASIRLDLYFVQVNRTRTLDLGMKMPGVVGQAELIGSLAAPASALIARSAVISTDFVPQLHLAQSQGWAKISRHIAVITSNGTQADFDSGGDFNAPSSNGLITGVTSIHYGTNLTVQPRYDETTGRIEMSIAASVSDLTPGAQLPGRTQSKVATVANVALGESLAVAGLFSENRERSRTGLPWLSQIPVIGLLFGQQEDKASDVENLVFIAPSVVEPLKHARAREFLANAFRQYDEFSGGKDEGRVFPGVRHELPAETTPAKTSH